jgi:thioredoxin 2
MTATYVPCEKCGVLNRVAQDETGKIPVCGSCKTELRYHGGVVEVSGSAMNNLIKNSPVPVLVDFWASWCGPCKMFAPSFARVALEKHGHAVFAKIDTDENQVAASKYGIKGIPTLIIFNKGVEIGRQVGALPEQGFRQLVDEVLDEARRTAAKAG